VAGEIPTHPKGGCCGGFWLGKSPGKRKRKIAAALREILLRSLGAGEIPTTSKFARSDQSIGRDAILAEIGECCRLPIPTQPRRPCDGSANQRLRVKPRTLGRLFQRHRLRQKGASRKLGTAF
jgi:hypothetical protein